MIYRLQVTNKNIYLEDLPINLTNEHCLEYEGIKVYTINNVSFCGISGTLTVYVGERMTKYLFTSYNLLHIFNVANIESAFEDTINKVKDYLSERYRQSDKLIYFNKSFIFTLGHSDNNISILITPRLTSNPHYTP